MRLALQQFSVPTCPEAALDRSVRAIEEAAAAGADLVLLPEGHLAPYFPQYPDRDARRYLVEGDAPPLVALQRACARCHIAAVPNLYLRATASADKGYSASPLIRSDGVIAGWTFKVHITCMPGFNEARYFEPAPYGLRGLPVYPTPLGTLAIVVCYDRHFPETFGIVAARGVRTVLIPTANVHGEPLELFEWELRTAARRHALCIAMCNRAGVEGRMRFCGLSLVVGPEGSVLARAGEGDELLCVALT